MALPLPPFFKRKTDRIHSIGEPTTLPKLSSQRLSLCWIDHADVASIYQIYSDNKVLRYSHQPVFNNQEDAYIYIESIHHGFNDGKLFQWGICLKGTQKIIGTCALSDISSAHGRAEAGYALSSEFRGHGYGREAMEILIQYAFNQLALRRLEADVDPHNTRCLKSLESLGFKREGYLKQRWQVAGELQDSVILGLMKSDFILERAMLGNSVFSASVGLE